jgi:hypothetical protein
MFRVHSDLLAVAGIKQPGTLCFRGPSEPYRFKRREFPERFGSRSRLRQNDIRREMTRDGVDATDVESGEGGMFQDFLIDHCAEAREAVNSG